MDTFPGIARLRSAIPTIVGVVFLLCLLILIFADQGRCESEKSEYHMDNARAIFGVIGGCMIAVGLAIGRRDYGGASLQPRHATVVFGVGAIVVSIVLLGVAFRCSDNDQGENDWNKRIGFGLLFAGLVSMGYYLYVSNVEGFGTINNGRTNNGVRLNNNVRSSNSMNNRRGSALINNRASNNNAASRTSNNARTPK